MTKGEDTRRAILRAGLETASQFGLESVTIGGLARAAGMSKSGLFAHFHSKENLQIEILNYAGREVTDQVIRPALRAAAGTARIRALVARWIDWTSRLTGGCIFVTASTEFSDRSGRVRDFLLTQQEQWLESLRVLARSAIRTGEFRADMDVSQFAFELYSLLLGFHYYHRLLHDDQSYQRQERSLAKLIESYRPPGDRPRRETSGKETR